MNQLDHHKAKNNKKLLSFIERKDKNQLQKCLRKQMQSYKKVKIAKISREI